jgi:MFS family permease
MGIFVTRLGDIYGRKLPTMISSLMAVPLLGCILYSENLTLTTVLFFMLGMTGPGKKMVGFVYAGEMFSEEYRTVVGSIILFTDSATMIFLPLYFKLISKNWLYFQLFYFTLSVISSLSLFLIPESPKYLLSKGLNDKAQKSFETIAKFNGVTNFTMVIKTEEKKEEG